ncbi:MAG: hypothetical protein ACI9VR_004886 [Cognaticolwellia sp.]|jgi:hypothetical protein
MFKRTLLLAPLLFAAATMAGTALAGQAALQQSQLTAAQAYTVYDIAGSTGDYKYQGIKETPVGAAELVLDADGEVFYLEWAGKEYCPDNPAHPLTFVQGHHKEFMDVAYCEFADDTSNRAVFVDGWGYRLQDYEGPESFNLNGVYQPEVMSKGALIVTQFKYVYGGYNKADYHAKVAAYLQEQAPIQAPLAQAWELEHAAELAEIELVSEAYWADMRERGNKALAAAFADDPGVTIVNDLGVDTHIDHSGTGADYWLKSGEKASLSCNQSIHQVDDSDNRIHTWETQPQHCGGEVGLSQL